MAIENKIREYIQKDQEDKVNGTVYVEGISYEADEGDVTTHFASCGNVKQVRMPRYQDSGKVRGYAHVVFETEEAVEKALLLNGKYLKKRYLTIQRAQKPKTFQTVLDSDTKKADMCTSRIVFIKHLPYDVEEKDIENALSECGAIVSVRLPMWNHTKKLKGFGYVEFDTEDAAALAAKRSGMKIGDRMVLIEMDGGAPKSSFRKTDGRYWHKEAEGKASLARKMEAKKGKKRARTN